MTIQDYQNASLKLQEFTRWSKTQRFLRAPERIKRAYLTMREAGISAGVSIRELAAAIAQVNRPQFPKGGLKVVGSNLKEEIIKLNKKAPV